MTYPEAYEEFPWGETAIKVNKKVFVFFGRDEELDQQLTVTTKLPESQDAALTLPYVERTGYGMGKSGWVTARFAPRDKVPIDLVSEWIDESYRAVAPKRLVKTLD